MPPKIPSTFERISATNKPLPDAFIEGALDSTLPGGEIYLKIYLDQLPADSSDIEFATNVDTVINFRNELSDLVSDNLRLVATEPLSETTRQYLLKRMKVYKEKISKDKFTVAAYLEGLAGGNRPDYPGSAYEYYGLSIPTTVGTMVDLLEGGVVGGVRSNVFMQREIAGLFVHFTSHEYLKKRKQGEIPPIEKRIYLNPRIEDAVKIFGDIFQAAQTAKLSLKGKILDRSYESNFMDRRFEHKKRLRGDGIVFYTSADEADSFLDIVNAVYKDNKSAFTDRKTSWVPLQIGPGIAIGDEPVGAGGQSLTSHRSDILELVIDQVKGRERDTPGIDRIKLFRALWDTAARAENINPINMAFNDDKKS